MGTTDKDTIDYILNNSKDFSKRDIRLYIYCHEVLIKYEPGHYFNSIEECEEYIKTLDVEKVHTQFVLVEFTRPFTSIIVKVVRQSDLQ